jgi:putative chitinase
LKIFPKYFNASQAEQYARRPIDIASRVYANRMGNGPEDSREGWRYRGRGIIQLTGKDNYERYGNIIGVDLVSDPELACDPVVSLQVACEYWKQRNINEDADNDDIYAITKKINGGTIGINHRIELFNRLYEKLE